MEETANMDKPVSQQPSGNELVTPVAPSPSNQDDRVRRGINAPGERQSGGRAYMRALGCTTNDYESVLGSIRNNIVRTER